MKCTQQYLDNGCFFEALKNLTKEMAFYLQREKAFLFRHIKKGDIVLDVGAGNGRSSLYLARKIGARGKIIAIDNNKSMLEKASEELKFVRNVELHKINAKKTPFNTNYFNAAIITFNTFGNLEKDERSKILKELHRLVKSKGYILGTVYSEDASNAQKEMYEHIGLIVNKTDKDFVYVNDIKFKSERFTEGKLREILSEISSNVKIERICDIAYGFSIGVDKNV